MFPCTSCGLCCQNISEVNELNDFDTGEGICKHYDDNTKSCAIYDDRPDICRVDKMFEIKYSKYFTRENFYKENANICNKLQNKHGLNMSYNVTIGG